MAKDRARLASETANELFLCVALPGNQKYLKAIYFEGRGSFSGHRKLFTL